MSDAFAKPNGPDELIKFQRRVAKDRRGIAASGLPFSYLRRFAPPSTLHRRPEEKEYPCHAMASEDFPESNRWV